MERILKTMSRKAGMPPGSLVHIGEIPAAGVRFKAFRYSETEFEELAVPDTESLLRLKEKEGTIEGNIGRNLKDRKKMQVFPDGSQGKPAITHYRVLEEMSYVNLVECILETGRTHQIRAHFEYVKHPIFGDEVYGGNKIVRGTTFTKYKQFVQNCFKILPRQALHAKSLGFTHPRTHKEMYFDSELPEDMCVVIEKWRNYIVGRETL